MHLHITDTFEFMRGVPQPSTIVTRPMTPEQAKLVVGSSKMRYAHFSDGVHARVAEVALGIRLHDSRQNDFAVANGDRILIVSASHGREWTPDGDTETICDQFLLIQIVA